jgi:hypothetical protein
MKKLNFFLIMALLLAVACDDDDDGNGRRNTASFTVTITNVATTYSFLDGGIFDTPVDAAQPGPAVPGEEYQITFDAGRNQRLSFATMLAATNDLFFGPDSDGIALYSNGEPVEGNITDQIYLWDAGTEINEEPAVGPNTVTQQENPNTGEDEDGIILKIDDVTTGVAFDYPAVSELLEVSLAHNGESEFTLTIRVLETAQLETSEGTVAAPISRGVWVVHGGENPLYTESEADLDQGLEAIAEDGDPATLGAFVESNTGVTFPISPGVWVVHNANTRPLYEKGAADFGNGLEEIAEDGNISVLQANLGSLPGEIISGVFNTPQESSATGPIRPGETYQFSFEAQQNEHLSLAAMLAATNDIFLGTADTGIALFNPDGTPIGGDITGQFSWWDAGTEENEQPAIGPNTVTNQAAADTGIDENGTVELLSDVDDDYSYPAVSQVVEITITSSNN